MQKVIYLENIGEISEYIDPKVQEYISEGQIETFESFPDFDIIAFDWFDIADEDPNTPQIIIYIDRDDIFFICENERSYEKASAVFRGAESNERALYLFFRNIFRNELKFIEEYEDRMDAMEEKVLVSADKELIGEIVDIRQDVLRLKKYYELMGDAFDGLCENDNGLISEEYMTYLNTLQNRLEKLTAGAEYLREYITQIRESYQAQMDIATNNLMKVFTLVTAIFMPLSLIAGWYGMNFVNMPELTWEYGYPMVIVVCIIICVIWFWIFKKNKWAGK